MHGTCKIYTRHIHQGNGTCTNSHTPPTCMAQVRLMHRRTHVHRHGPYTSHPRHMHGTRTVHASYTPTTSHAQHIHRICIQATSRAPSIHDSTYIHTVHAEHAQCVRGTYTVHMHHMCSTCTAAHTRQHMHGTRKAHTRYMHMHMHTVSWLDNFRPHHVGHPTLLRRANSRRMHRHLRTSLSQLLCLLFL